MAATASGANILHLGAEALRRLPIPDIELADQCRTANFLDDQVARIDKVVAARRKQLDQLSELFGREFQDLFDTGATSTRPLSTLTDPRRPIQYGIVLPGPDFSGGVPIVKGGDISGGRVRRGELNRTDPEIERRYVRSRLIGGDLVIAIRGSVGEVDVVPHELAGANLTQDAARIAPFGCDDAWLRWALTVPSVRSDIRRRVTGAMVPGINIEALKQVRLPNTELAAQRRIGRRAGDLAGAHALARLGLTDSERLFVELKRALITAAVMGEFDVSSADGSRVAV